MPLTYQIIFRLFNSALHNAECPQLWKTAKLIPIDKRKGSNFDPNSYRRIAVHCAIYKAYSGIFHERLKVWSDIYSILPATQHCFRSGSSTFTAIQTLYDTIKEAIVFKPYFGCFVDFEKALDSINRTSLLSKLRSLGVSNRFIKVIFSMIDRNNISLSTGKYLQEPITQTVGLAQGDKLSTLLFAIFIADLSDTLLSAPNQPMIFFYADGLAIGTTDLTSLQEYLNTLHKYCQMNRFSVNVRKTKIMRFCKGGGLKKKPNNSYGKEPIELVIEFVYLGVKFQTNLKPTKHLKHLVTTAAIATNSLITTLDLNKISLISATRLFNTGLISAAAYSHHIFKDLISAEVWNNHKRQIYSIFFQKMGCHTEMIADDAAD